VNGKLSTSELINYVVSQLVGGVLWALVAYALVSQATFVAPSLNASVWQVVLSEFLFTFALVWVVYNTAVNSNNGAKSFYGLAIGVTVLVWAYSVWSISGWAFNPAVAFAHQLVQSIFTDSVWLSNIWMYLVWQLLGAYVAAVAYKNLA
jgi:aquaporin Z